MATMIRMPETARQEPGFRDIGMLESIGLGTAGASDVHGGIRYRSKVHSLGTPAYKVEVSSRQSVLGRSTSTSRKESE